MFDLLEAFFRMCDPFAVWRFYLGTFSGGIAGVVVYETFSHISWVWAVVWIIALSGIALGSIWQVRSKRI